MSPTPSIAVAPGTEALRARSRDLAHRLGLPVTTTGDCSYAFLLVLTDKRLELRQTGKNPPGPLSIDFVHGPIGYRLRHGGAKQLLARAVGMKKGRRPSILDLTAGLGRDGFILASLGCRVRMVERSPILAALVAEGLKRAAVEPELAAIVRDRLSLTEGDGLKLLPRLAAEDQPEVIYLDPMYPHRSKSALVKKEMRMIRSLVGDDPDAPGLLTASLDYAANRVVVKRPLTAPPLTPTPKAGTVITGKTHRYDIYLV